MNSRTSYVQGACDQPLIGATIGEMFDAMALEHAGARRAGGSASERAVELSGVEATR